MKLSKAILKGFEMAGGNQCKRNYCEGDPTAPQAVCAIGAAALAICGDADAECKDVFPSHKQLKIFYSVIGISIPDLNDKGMSIPDIAGIAKSIGL